MGLKVLIIPLLMASTFQAAGDRLETLGGSMICMCRGRDGGCGQLVGSCDMVGCPTSGSMRRELKQYVDQGKADRKILALFAEKYGPRVLAAPPFDTWFNVSAWVTPLGALLAGGVVLVGFLKRSRRSLSLRRSTTNYESEIEEELRKLRLED